MPYMSLDQIRGAMHQHGAVRIHTKQLAANDNTKNQVYFGSDFAALNLFPNLNISAEDTGKRPHFKARLDFHWLTRDGAISPAPSAQLILYPQYPEVRFSGFLRACLKPPSELMTSRTPRRVLFLGIAPSGRVIGYVVPPDSEAAAEVRALQLQPSVAVFSELPSVEGAADTREALIAALRAVHLKGWIASKRLSSSGSILPCTAPQCGGYTLEAELGVLPSGKATPDFLGWEIKQFDVSDFDRLPPKPITLMTPEPTGGYYGANGVRAFTRRFGYKDKHGRPDRINFGGIHRIGDRVDLTGLRLTLLGFDAGCAKIVDVSGGIALLTDDDERAALWPFASLMEHWNRKHAQAAYVPSMRRITPLRQYRYGHTVKLGRGTDFGLFIKAVATGRVYYDPGIKVEQASSAHPRAKPRSQFRVKYTQVDSLYHEASAVRLVR